MNMGCTTSMFLPLTLMLMAYLADAEVRLTTSSTIPRTSELFKLTCSTTGTENVSWLKDGEFQSTCLVLSPSCYTLPSSPFKFSSDNDSKSSVLTITDVSMDSCGNFTCSDKSGNKDSVQVNVIHFNSDDLLQTIEPVQESSGTITVTTNCIFPNYVTIQWIKVQNGIDIGAIENYTQITENCKANCAGSPAVKIRTSFQHNEAKGKYITAAYKVVIKHWDVVEPITWTSQLYKIEVNTRMTSEGSDNKRSILTLFATVLGIKMIKSIHVW
ncbi:uncharacterized protein LOC128234219 [Mya arenaria]|uniref:uncharacterized protein LOC128234219 n=1 Tax=Mya arenaria TaxID=6604 RepID=UPI0022E2D581|nr:uncharacterized protein LOC128234219 [Mya arenaria]